MNSKERVNAAMRLEVPDCVPVFCQLAMGHYMVHSGLDHMEVWFDSEVLAEAMVIMQRRYQFDGILVNSSGRPRDWRDHIDRIEDMPGEQWIWWTNGNFSKLPYDDNAHYYQADETRYFPSFDEVDPEKLYYVEPWDITDVTYPFDWSFDGEPRPFDDFFPPYLHDTLKAVIDKAGPDVNVHSEIFSPFSQFLELLNYEFALVALIDDPEKCHACLEALVRGSIDLGCRQVRCGPDAILISSGFAGNGFLSRESYAEFVLPYEKKVVEGIKQQCDDIPIYVHTCGGIGDRLDLMMEAGYNGIDTLDPPPLGTVELDEAIQQTKGQVFIKGNIDPVNSLLLGNTETVKEAVDNRLTIAKPGGGYILSTACSVAPRTKPELLEYMVERVHELGRYDVG